MTKFSLPDTIGQEESGPRKKKIIRKLPQKLSQIHAIVPGKLPVKSIKRSLIARTPPQPFALGHHIVSEASSLIDQS